MNNTSITLSLDTRKPKKDGTFPLLFRITHFRKPLPISTGISLLEKDWDEEAKVVKKSYVGTSTVSRLNNLLAKTKATYTDALLKLHEQGRLTAMSVHEVRDCIAPKSSADSFITYGMACVEELRKDKRFGTANAYQDAIRAMQNFNKKKDLKFLDITSKFLKEFERAHKDKGNALNGFAAYMRSVRAIYNKAIDAKIVDEDVYPFNHYKIATTPTIKRALDWNVLKGIIEHDFAQENPLFKTRNYFLASYMMYGMNFCDMAYLQTSDITDGRIDYNRSKTGKAYNIKITPSLQKILDYFKPFTAGTNYIFPIIKRIEPIEQDKDIKWARKRYNKRLKELATECNVEKKLTTYVSRHSFATHASYADIPITAISTMLGHSSIKTTQIYLDTLPKRTIDEYNAGLVNAL